VGVVTGLVGVASAVASGLLDSAARIAEARDPEAQRIATQARAEHRERLDRRGLLVLRERLALDLARAQMMARTGGPIRRRRGAARMVALAGTLGEVDAEIARGG
jgi:hypothetical protein